MWLSYCVLLGGVASAVASAYLVISTYSSLPHWDEWALFDHLARNQGWSLNWLWAQHNEHRILLPKIFFLLDVYWFRGTQTFLLLSIFLVQLLQITLLSASLRILVGLRDAAWRIGTGFIGFCIACPTQYENLVWGFQLQFVIPAAMATLAILSLLMFYHSSDDDRGNARWVWLLLCVVAAMAATWSLANGMLLWPLLLFTALILRMRRSTVAALLIAGAANVGLYFFHYHRPAPDSGTIPALHSLGNSMEYVAVYFGSTFVRHSSGKIALIAGSVGIAVAFVIIARAFRRRRNGSLFQLQLSLLMALCIATAAITASGRLHLGLEQASASRYQTFALLFWCCLGLSLLSGLAQRATLNGGLTAYAGFCLLLMLGFGTQFRLPLTDAQWHQLRLKQVSLALMTGVHDPVVLADAYPYPDVVIRSAEYMKRQRLSIFAGKQYSQLGQPITSAYQLPAPSTCSGYVSSSQLLPSDRGQGLRLTGFAWDGESQRPAKNVIAVEDGVIAGFGTSVSIPLGANHVTPQADPTRYGWAAFVRDVHAGERVDLYVVEGDRSHSLCQFAEANP